MRPDDDASSSSPLPPGLDAGAGISTWASHCARASFADGHQTASNAKPNPPQSFPYLLPVSRCINGASASTPPAAADREARGISSFSCGRGDVDPRAVAGAGRRRRDQRAGYEEGRPVAAACKGRAGRQLGRGLTDTRPPSVPAKAGKPRALTPYTPHASSRTPWRQVRLAARSRTARITPAIAITSRPRFGSARLRVEGPGIEH